jgi:hypothetical protein
MKIDAEGHQAAILQGVGAHLLSNKIRDIVLEEEAKFSGP